MARDKLQLFIEAKKINDFNIVQEEHALREDIGIKFESAKHSASLLKDDIRGNKIAAAFVSLLFGKSLGKDYETSRQQCMKVLATVADAVAMFTHSYEDAPVNPSDSSGNQIYVGMALLLAKV